jgi:hypothetical protein
MALGGFAAAAAGFAAENIVATMVGNAGEQVFQQARLGIANVLRKGGRPVNHDLQRAVRKAYLQATLYLCERCEEELKGELSLGAQVLRSFTPEIKGLAHLYRLLGEELKQVGDDAYLLPSSEADRQSELLLQPSGAEEEVALLRSRLREALLEELAASYDAQFGALPSRLVEMVEEGWQERGADEQLVRLYWFDLLCAFFAHELKFNPVVRDIFTSKALAELLVNGQALDILKV